MSKRLGKQTIALGQPVAIVSTASIVGKKEGQGPLAPYFDRIEEDILLGKDTWEKAESEFIRSTIDLAIKKSGIPLECIDYIVSGDLLNQNTGSTFGIIEFARPFLGIFSACSAMGEGLSLGAMLVDGDFAGVVAVSASSHFCSAEKQFRFPLELGTQRPLSSTWTVTGAGAAILTKQKTGVCVTGMTTGKIVDLGISDVNNMGSAMAPAAADTIMAHFRDTNQTPKDYDLIITGDLGYIGSSLVTEIMGKEGFDMSKNYTDCGIEIFDQKTQDTHSGGSGCACSATTFSSYYYHQLQKKQLNRILFVPTGALLSPTSAQQGQTIPGIAHAVVIENK